MGRTQKGGEDPEHADLLSRGSEPATPPAIATETARKAEDPPEIGSLEALSDEKQGRLLIIYTDLQAGKGLKTGQESMESEKQMLRVKD
ncbi:hypothetical protein AV530_002196 [Patagioenas fasciata monilis]|uniref:Uncharacterized protein n=1 Tax=Patagioenas fasciata monilis TaxID=372326 RepID=A0A1V4K731_PATFA|nr:hypothetical protein AV530_002196 [Patagioenas fasciata monilis]